MMRLENYQLNIHWFFQNDAEFEKGRREDLSKKLHQIYESGDLINSY